MRGNIKSLIFQGRGNRGNVMLYKLYIFYMYIWEYIINIIFQKFSSVFFSLISPPLWLVTSYISPHISPPYPHTCNLYFPNIEKGA